MPTRWTYRARYLKLPWVRENYEELAAQAAHKKWSHVEFLAHLVEGETHLRMDRATERRIKAARFPVIKTLDQFDWSWPKKINRHQVQNLFRLPFIEMKHNVIFICEYPGRRAHKPRVLALLLDVHG